MGISRYTAAAALINAAAAMAGCTSSVDESLIRTEQRMQSAYADETFHAQAGGTLTEAQRTLREAYAADSSAEQRHLAYMAEKKLELAEAVVARGLAEREYAALQLRQGAGSEVSLSSPSRAVPHAADSVAANVGAMERNRADAAQGQNRGDQVLAERVESALQRLDVRKRSASVIPVPQINFAAGATALSLGAKRRLDPLISHLREDSSFHVLVEGYSDGTGTHEVRLQTSLARAEAVKSYLVESGIPAERVQTLGLGSQYPVAADATEEGRRQNRRVEIVLVRTGGPQPQVPVAGSR